MWGSSRTQKAQHVNALAMALNTGRIFFRWLQDFRTQSRMHTTSVGNAFDNTCTDEQTPIVTKKIKD